MSTDWVSLNYYNLEKNLNGAHKTPLYLLREQALGKFLAQGFPSPTLEDWKYTNVQELQNVPFVLPKSKEEACSKFLNLPQGIKAYSLAEVFSSDTQVANIFKAKILQERNSGEALSTLNTVFLREGIFLYIEPGFKCDVPVHIRHETRAKDFPLFVPLRMMVVAGEESKVSVVESFQGEAQYFTNSFTEIIIGASSSVNYIKLVEEGDKAYHYGHLRAELKQSSEFHSHVFTFGGLLTRNEIFPVLDGPESRCTLQGLSILSGNQHVDNHTLIDHAKPQAQSTELYKGIYSGRSRGVFSGTIVVRPQAQKTNAIQTNRSLLLSPDASIETRPQLKIWADDVKCTHGATVGALDEEALYYLRTRGISRSSAQEMLTRAFAEEVLSGVEDSQLRVEIGERITRASEHFCQTNRSQNPGT